MNIAFCYESVLPARGGCETYIADLARRLLADRHEVHLYACRWDEQALPEGIVYHELPATRGPRFLRPWRFARRCLAALTGTRHHVTMGFDKTWGQDVLYPQGGLHAASVVHNRNKFATPLMRGLARVAKWLDVAHWSFTRLERRQYLKPADESPRLRGERPQIIVNSLMVRRHFQEYLGIPGEHVCVVRSAIDPDRFLEHDRPRVRAECRERWGLSPRETIGLIAAMNYRLKGLEPLLHALQRLFARSEYRHAPPDFRLLVAGSPHTRPWERLATRLGIRDRVVFIGHCAPMRHAYFAADFLVHPTFYDPCSLVVLEALACGLPVITTRANGASELLQPPVEGYVIADPHEHEVLAECIVALLDPARRAACAHAARRAAAQWTFEDHYRELLDVFSEVAAGKHAA